MNSSKRFSRRESIFFTVTGITRDSRKESNRFDPGMLRRIRTYQRVIGRGIDRITMPDTVLDRRGQIDASVVTAASELYAVTPTPRRVRVTGRLDVMGASQGVLKLDVRPRNDRLACQACGQRGGRSRHR